MKCAQTAGLIALLAAATTALTACTSTLNWVRNIEEPTPTTYWTGYTYPTLGLGVSLAHSEKPRYKRFQERHAGIDRLDVLEYLALNPDACTPQRPCAFTPASREHIRQAFNTYHHADPRPTGVRWRIRDQESVPNNFFATPRRTHTTTTVTTIMYTSVDTIIISGNAPRQSTQQAVSRPHNSVVQQRSPPRTDTVFVRGRTDTVYVRRPPQTDTVYVNEQLPQDTVLMERSGRRYTFPGAAVVCYEEPRRACVRIPGRE